MTSELSKKEEYKKNDRRLKKLKEEVKKNKELVEKDINKKENRKDSTSDDYITFPTMPNTYSYGWICPVCGRGNAPYVKTCPCIPNFPSYEVTCQW